ncbi:MAG TPA: tetratricopeptide repeat protein [Chitinophagaceae bacterium]|nr:tetratricopeptide repeat protein [Chitinophagaceae bacterium]
MSSARQLAAIMFTDIVGYTALMGNNEQKAFSILNKNRALQKPIIEQYNGRWIKELGDGVMASFNTVSDAVNAAIKIQQTCNSSKEFQLRIGIHLGEVVFENDDVFGDGVNIASRIQALAPPGGIWVSEAVHHNVANKNNIETVFVKNEPLKNVKEPVRIFQVKAEGIAAPVLKYDNKDRVTNTPGYKKFLGIAVGAIVIIVGYFIYTNFQKNTKDPISNTSEETIDKSIAVLPFVNMSDDKEQEYFSDGLSEELLNLLAKIPELKVIGRTSSFAFKGKNEDLRTIAQKLGVAHLLEGSVRKDGNKIRVTAELIKATDGSQLWRGTYDRDLKGIFQLQDEIATAVVQQLKLKLLEIPSSKVSDTGNVEAYNLILQGNHFFDKLDKESVAKAVDFYNQAIAIDSTNARAWGKLANAISRQSWQNYIDRIEGREKARMAAMKSIQLNKSLAIGYLELGDLKLYHDFDWKGAEEIYQKALILEPENPDILYSLGGGLYFAIGRWKESIELMKKSIELDPLRPISHLNLGNILTHAGRAEEAIAYFKKALELNPQFQRAHLYLGRNYLLLGKTEMALKEMQQENFEVFRAFGMSLVYPAIGKKKEADDALKNFTERFQSDWSYLLAELYAYRGEKDKALMWLENAYSKKDGWLVFLKGDPLLKNLKDDDRYKAFMKKMNLTFD